MTTYNASYHCFEIQRADRAFDAESPEEALDLACQLPDAEVFQLDFYCPDAAPNLWRVAILGPFGSAEAEWCRDDLLLHRAASDLLEALEQAVAALNSAPRFAVPHLDTDSYEIAARCDRAIRTAKGGAA